MPLRERMLNYFYNIDQRFKNNFQISGVVALGLIALIMIVSVPDAWLQRADVCASFDGNIHRSDLVSPKVYFDRHYWPQLLTWPIEKQARYANLYTQTYGHCESFMHHFDTQQHYDVQHYIDYGFDGINSIVIGNYAFLTLNAHPQWRHESALLYAKITELYTKSILDKLKHPWTMA